MRREAEAKAAAIKAAKAKADSVLVTEEEGFVPPKPNSKGQGAKETQTRESAKQEVMVTAVMVQAECRVCKKAFSSNEADFLGKGLCMPKTCPPCCKERAVRNKATALMVFETESDEDSEQNSDADVMMLVVDSGPVGSELPWLVLQGAVEAMHDQDRRAAGGSAQDSLCYFA